jgi:hypothetical protein
VGAAVQFGVVADNQPWARVQDVTFRNNVIRRAASAFDIRYRVASAPESILQRVDIQNNLAYDLGPQWGPTYGLITLNQPAQGPVRFDHNTILNSPLATNALISIKAGETYPYFTFTNNIVSQPAGAFGASILDSAFPGVDFQANVLVAQNALAYGKYADTNHFPANLEAVGFIQDPTRGVSDWRTLGLSPTSPFRLKGTDGADLGAVVGPIDSLLR